MRFLFRFLGFWIIASSFVIFVYDGTRSISDSDVVLTSTGGLWVNIHSDSLENLQAYLQETAPSVWDPTLLYLLNAPAFAILLLFGIIFMVIGAKRERVNKDYT